MTSFPQVTKTRGEAVVAHAMTAHQGRLRTETEVLTILAGVPTEELLRILRTHEGVGFLGTPPRRAVLAETMDVLFSHVPQV
jgi:hypothetical protein